MALGFSYGPLFALYLGPHLTVVVNTHQHVREVLLLRGKDFAGRPRMVRLRNNPESPQTGDPGQVAQVTGGDNGLFLIR